MSTLLRRGLAMKEEVKRGGVSIGGVLGGGLSLLEVRGLSLLNEYVFLSLRLLLVTSLEPFARESEGVW